jgi:hypothetical protein
MTTPPERKTSAAPIKVTESVIPGDNKGSSNVNMDIAKVQANSVTMNQYLPIRSPLETGPVIKTQGFISGPCPIENGALCSVFQTEGPELFYSESAEYTLCVIGILCIVYGVIAK